ncbi:MAG: homocysteine S-methyltransferase family protein [Clostridia bacterium]|nr:homocysteine S-methyltransferase family protein [Clostridia bacterium]
MKNDLRLKIQQQRLYFDGGTGTVLQGMGLPAGTPPEQWNLTHPEKIVALHSAYLDAGCNVINTNTFGVNCQKYPNYRELIAGAMSCAKAAVAGRDNVYIAFDMGPTGHLLEPLGDLSFEQAVAIYAANVKLAVEFGADCILIETMNDSYETKAAVLAAKENSRLPVFVTNVYDGSGKLMTGADPAAMVALLEGLGVDALGLNCSLGPAQMIPLVEQLAQHTSLPLMVCPNAGLPEVRNGETVFTVTEEEFADHMVTLVEKGACILGGCCGTTPAYLEKVIQKTKALPYRLPEKKNKTVISSYTHGVEIGPVPILIGERINPTGKPKLKEALRQGDLQYLMNEGVRQADAGAHILDVNVGLPEIDEGQMMAKAVVALQEVTDLPLQLDSNDPKVLANAMRLYNGKPLINSVNGEEEKMDAIFPLVQKYGGAVIALTMDKEGIPPTAQGRLEIAQRIAQRAAQYGISKKELIVDPLALTVSSHDQAALVTLEAVALLKEQGFHTSLGVSNVSFGLPAREKINAAFFAGALERGLSCAIMNPFATGMMDTYYAFNALHGLDPACGAYIGYAAGQETKAPTATQQVSLHYAVVKGMKAEAAAAAARLLESCPPLDCVNQHLLPALNEIGADFEAGKAYLPQLLMSAEAAAAAFDLVKEKMPPAEKKDHQKIILATVEGDIHDIGKNIVKVLLESYGFTVVDLGRDVAPEQVLTAVRAHRCSLVGLSALMTTTVPAMAKTIALLKSREPGVAVMVGGAVLNQEYAQMIRADYYGRDAMEAVRIAQQFYQKV